MDGGCPLPLISSFTLSHIPFSCDDAVLSPWCVPVIFIPFSFCVFVVLFTLCTPVFIVLPSYPLSSLSSRPHSFTVHSSFPHHPHPFLFLSFFSFLCVFFVCICCLFSPFSPFFLIVSICYPFLLFFSFSSSLFHRPLLLVSSFMCVFGLVSPISPFLHCFIPWPLFILTFSDSSPFPRPPKVGGF